MDRTESGIKALAERVLKSLKGAWRRVTEPRFALIRERTLLRAQREEQRKYSRLPFQVGASIVLGLMVFAVYFSVDPGEKPHGVRVLARQGPEKFQTVVRGKIFLAKGEPPFNKVDYEQSLVFDSSVEKWPTARSTLKAYGDLTDFWYEFEIDLENSPLAKQVGNEEIGLLIPKVFGKTTLYRDGVKIDFRRDFRPIVALTQPRTKIHIHVRDVTSKSLSVGIIAYYPLIVGKFSDLDSIVEFIQAEVNRYRLALVMQFMALLVLCGLALAGPFMAELLPLILFFSVNIGDCYTTLLKATGGLPFVLAKEGYYFLKWGMAGFQGVVLLWFLAEFFRKDSALTIRAFKRVSVVGFLWQSFVFSMAFSVFEASNPWIIPIALNFAFFAWAILYTVGWDYLFVLNSSGIWLRKTFGTILLLSVYNFLYWSIMSYLSITDQTTSEFLTQFHSYLVVLVVTAIELGRNNRQQDRQRKKLPKERTSQFLPVYQDNQYPVHRGFIVLCDGVGYSVKLARLYERGLPAVSHFQAAILHYLLTCFDHPMTSKHSMTGDGFYLGIPVDLNERNLADILERCLNVVGSRVRLRDLGVPWFGDEEMSFRVILSYSDYCTIEVVARSLGSEVLGGVAHTLLARNSGSREDPIALRVLINQYMAGFERIGIGKVINANNKSAEELESKSMEFTAAEVNQILREDRIRKILGTKPVAKTAA